MHVFPCLVPVACFPSLGTASFPSSFGLVHCVVCLSYDWSGNGYGFGITTAVRSGCVYIGPLWVTFRQKGIKTTKGY